jgi:putative membrane protein
MILTELSTSLTAFVGGWWILPGPLFWLLLVVGIVFLARARSGGSTSGGARETGIEVLERRFAEGELSLEQYRERRSVLEQER